MHKIAMSRSAAGKLGAEASLETNLRRYEERVLNYMRNPTRCKHCGKPFYMKTDGWCFVITRVLQYIIILIKYLDISIMGIVLIVVRFLYIVESIVISHVNMSMSGNKE